MEPSYNGRELFVDQQVMLVEHQINKQHTSSYVTVSETDSVAILVESFVYKPV